MSPIGPPVTPAIPPTIKPTDLSGCVVWLETNADGTIVNRLAETTGHEQTIIASSDPATPERGVLIVIDRTISPAEEAFLLAYATNGAATTAPGSESPMPPQPLAHSPVRP